MRPGSRWQAVAVLLVFSTLDIQGELPSGPISSTEIETHLKVLGSDALGGRAPGTAGGNEAARYLARELGRIGVMPCGDTGSFFQQVPLHASAPLSESKLLVLSSGGEERRLRLGDDYLLYTSGDQTWITRPTKMVFVGYGIVAPEFDHNDYLGIDVQGRVVVALEGEPPSDDPEFFDGPYPSIYSSPEAKQRMAMSRGAVGSLLISRESSSQAWVKKRQIFSLEGVRLAYDVPHHLSALLRQEVARELFLGSSLGLSAVLELDRQGAMTSFPLTVSVSFHGVFRSRSFLAPNVVGIIPGSGPRLKDRGVVLSAHYDHLGMGPEGEGSPIYNGAVDNALGVAGVLAVSRKLMALPSGLRRSIIVLFTTAEETGLLGASYFLDHSPLPTADLAANINVDGLAFHEAFRDVIDIGGSLSDLGLLLASAARRQGLEVSRAPPIFAAKESFSRSDQMAFAEAGVPSILVNEGFQWERSSPEQAMARTIAWLETVYHTPRDDLDQPLDLRASAQHAELIFQLVQTTADHPREIRWKPGTRYEYIRLLALAGRD